MPEVLWEIWYQKRNVHHRVSMDFNETPQAVFQRIMAEFDGTEKALPTQIVDPNTGREIPVQWDFSFRSRGKENRIKDRKSFAEQGVGDGSLIVARSRDIRAHTIYIDGTAGLADEELRVARSKMPLIFALLVLVLGGAGAAYYYYVFLPEQQRKAPYVVNVGTEPHGSEVSILLDLKNTPTGKVKRFQALKFVTPAKNVMLPKKSKVIYISITKKKYQTWKKGFEKDAWLKDQTDFKDAKGKVVKAPRKLIAINPKELTIPGFLPDELDKKPPPPTFKVLKAPTPKALKVKYPRRWRRMRVGLDPTHGGKDRGAVGYAGPPASALNLKIAQAVQEHLLKVKRRRRRRYRVYMTRKDNKDLAPSKRARKLRWMTATIQLDFAVGHKEYKKASKTTKKDGSIVHYNDSVAGFKVFWSGKNRRSKKSKKLAKCLAASMAKAGFLAHRTGEPKKAKQPPVREFRGDSAVLNGRSPAARLVLGYLSHRAEEKVFMQDSTHKILATVIEDALVCFKK